MKFLVFIDVAGYTNRLNSNPEKTKEILEIYDSVIEKKTTTMDGEIVSKAGDGYYIQFPTDKNPEIILNGLKEIIKSLENIRDFMSIRIGFHIGSIESHTERNIDINFTQRLETSTNANEINISEIIYSLSKEALSKENIKEDTVDLKGFGKSKIFRVRVLEHKPAEEYGLPKIENKAMPIIINNENFKAKILIDKSGKAMIEQETIEGSKIYVEMTDDGVFTRIDLSQYKLILPPDEDIIEKTQVIENNITIVKLRYKWNGILKLKYNASGDMIGFSSENLITTVSSREKEILFKYDFNEDKAIVFSPT